VLSALVVPARVGKKYISKINLALDAGTDADHDKKPWAQYGRDFCSKDGG
jgi:hypothetical protein